MSVALRAEPIEGSATLEIEVLMFATIAPRINVVRIIPAFAGAAPNVDGAAAPVVVDTSTSCQLASRNSRSPALSRVRLRLRSGLALMYDEEEVV